jgi:hypothetical protein
MTDLCDAGHNFTQRYSSISPTSNQITAADAGCWDDPVDTARVIEALHSKKYVCDVCEVCGLTVGILKETQNALDTRDIREQS